MIFAIARKSPAGIRAFAFIVIVFAPWSHAHQQWLAPNAFFETTDSAWVSFDHTFSDHRFFAGYSPGSYYQWWVVGPDGVKRSVPNLFIGKTRVVGELELEAPGTYRVGGEEPSMAWTRIEIDGQEVWQPGSRENFPNDQILLSRTYFNHALTYVSLGVATRGALAPTGAPLEIVFLDHPNTLIVGEKFRVKAISDGQVLAKQLIEVFAAGVSAHDAAAASCTTGVDGSCELAVTSKSRYLVATDTQGDFQQGADTDSYSYNVTVMIEVTGPAR